MQTWEYLVLNVTYHDENENIVKFAVINDEYIFSNVLKDELHIYLKELEKDGWKLENAHSEDQTHESYHFKRLVE
jgi:hypothetical protein